MKMNCRKAQFEIGLLLDGRIEGREEALLMEHIRSCAVCREEFSFQKCLVEAIGTVEMEGPREGGWERLLQRIRAEERTAPRMLPRFVYAIVGALTAILLAVSLWHFAGRMTEQHPTLVKKAPRAAVNHGERMVSTRPPAISEERAQEHWRDAMKTSPVREGVHMRKIYSHKGRLPRTAKYQKRPMPRTIAGVELPGPAVETSAPPELQPETASVPASISEQLDETLAKGLMVLVEAAGSEADGANQL